MSVQNITMPQLGESVTEGTIEKWLVKPGDTVKKYDSLAEVVTDKVNAEIKRNRRHHSRWQLQQLHQKRRVKIKYATHQPFFDLHRSTILHSIK